MSPAPRPARPAVRRRDTEPADNDTLLEPWVDDAGAESAAPIPFLRGYLRVIALGLLVGGSIIAAIILNWIRM
jgi:hypothetical protein